MFYHDNEKLKVFANTRCGSTNMRYYFKIDRGEQLDFPKEFSENLVIVLRNPIDRMISAVKGAPEMSLAALPKHALKKVLAKEITMEYLLDISVFKVHCYPYLHEISTEPFRIIDFNRLIEYIPRKSELLQSPTTNTNNYTDAREAYIENIHFSLSDLQKEYDAYLSLLKEREQISVAEWKEKTT
jgi:hypothetical protein